MAHPTRFTDHFQDHCRLFGIGRPQKRLSSACGGKLLAYRTYRVSCSRRAKFLAPEVRAPSVTNCAAAPAPFCWFADSPPELIVRAFYLSTILSQHIEHWKLLLTSIDPDLKAFSEMDTSLIGEAAPELVSIDPHRADRDLLEVEASLSKDMLNLILLDQLKLITNGRFAEVIESEHYSVLIRSLALLVGLDSLLSDTPPLAAHEKLGQVLFAEADGKRPVYRTRPSQAGRT